MFEQEAQGGKFLPAFFVEPVVLGEEFGRGELPLHMTYFPPLQTNFNPQYARVLREYINPMEPFMARIGESDTTFGAGANEHVKLVEPSRELIAVHRKIVSVLQYLPHSTQYRTPFRPHVTIPEGDPRVETGDTIEVGGFSIVEMNSMRNTWQVIAKIGLKGADMTTDATIIKANK